MSHQVTVKFQGLSIQMQVQCDSAVASLCKIDKTLNFLHENASKCIDSKFKEYEDYLLTSKSKIKNEIEELKSLANQHKGELMDYGAAQRFNHQANRLVSVASDLTGVKLSMIEQIINEGLISQIEKVGQKFIDEVNGVHHFDEQLLSKINSIEDISLRELCYIQMTKGLEDFSKIIENAQKEYDVILGRTNIVESITQDLKASGLSQEEITKIVDKPITSESVSKMNEEANNAINDEKIRKQTLKVIIKSIRDRGFIVDTKNNLKIDRKSNILKLVAKKPDGKTAEFEISLNGKFMYHFDGYEGQACQKDITPFMDDLKNIYGINVLHEEVEWSNPDKIQTQKYQYHNTNKGKN